MLLVGLFVLATLAGAMDPMDNNRGYTLYWLLDAIKHRVVEGQQGVSLGPRDGTVVACYRAPGKSLCYRVVDVVRGKDDRIELVVNPCEVDGHEPANNLDCAKRGVPMD